MPEEKEEKPKTRRSSKKKAWHEKLARNQIPRELFLLTVGQKIRMKHCTGRVSKISVKGLPLEIDYRDKEGNKVMGEAFKLEDYVGLK